MSAKASKPAAISSTHLIQPETLAPSSFSLPKIPQKDTVKKEPPPVQLAMAEIVEQADEIQLEQLIHNVVEESKTENNYTASKPLDVENAKQAFHIFAEKLSPSLKPLIRLLEPEIKGNNIAVKLTAQQIEMTEKIKVDWQFFLRQYFNLQSLFLEIRENNEIDTTRKAYTAKEQLDEMIAENPNILALIQKFNLKIK